MQDFALPPSPQVESKDNEKTGTRFLQEEGDEEFYDTSKRLSDSLNGHAEDVSIDARNQPISRAESRQVPDQPAKHVIQMNMWPTVDMSMLAVAAFTVSAALVAHFVFQASLLATGIIVCVGVSCLVAAAIVCYCNKPSSSLENNSVEVAGMQIAGK